MSIVKTEAFKKIEKYRDSLNTGRAKVECKFLTCVFYLYESAGNFVLLCYKGRSKKSHFRYGYNSADQRDNALKNYLKQFQADRIRKQPNKRLLSVGDVLMGTWGYEQTNVNYYKVLRLSGKQSVELVEIGAIKTFDGDMSGHCVPNLDNHIKEPFIKKVDGDRVWFEHFSAKRLGYEEKEGERVYKATYFSSYA